ncbi:MAG: hypothetical protein QOF51_1399 [Chloroflexota bacterium]|jgi:hypothetical protein|nr:hypothetical protein [Chloroflexota bacterium]
MRFDGRGPSMFDLATLPEGMGLEAAEVPSVE